ncbi:MAG: hypothetical protein H0V01_09160 [Bacteroidetes bacterium]|nr:hypothetical protein [Bacteroidota bacterium]HET6243092.1 hypothetical protein [Bacteroidia bacterium]
MEENHHPTYEIIPPAIPTGSAYYFTTDNKIQYEVRFGRKQDNFLNATIVFGVLNEEYEGEEYVVTNKGEIYKVMATIVRVVKMYMSQHPNVNSFEYTGEPNKEIADGEPSTRIRLYERYLKIIFDQSWNYKILGNKTIITKIKK